MHYFFTKLTHIRKLLYAAAASCAACITAAAQSTDSISGGRRLAGVTVTESMRNNLTSSAAPLHIVDTENMLRLGVADMADALHRMPGVTLRDYGGAGGVKTVSVRGFGAGHTGVSYDGIVVSDCQTGETDVSRYSIENAGSIALTVGADDDIFIPARNAAYASMLAISTAVPPPADRSQHVTAQIKAGSFGYISPFIRYSRNCSDRLTLALTGEYVYADNDYPFTLRNANTVTRQTRTNSRMKSGHGEASIAWRPSRRSRLEAKAYYYDNNRQLPGQVRYYTDISNERLHDINCFVQAQYRTWNDGNLALRINAKFNRASSEYTDGTYKGGIKDACYRQHEAYTSACLLYTPLRKWAFNYSADYIFNNLNSSLSADTRPRRHTVLQTLAARYKDSRLTAVARLLMSVYLNNAEDGPAAGNMSRLSPSASVSYRLLPGEELYARMSYKNIFRAPTFNELYYYHYGSTDLLPESTDQINLGLTWTRSCGRSSRFRVSADGYVNKVTDKIVAVPYNMFIWRTVNVGKVKGRGIEAEASLSHGFGHGCTLNVNINYTWQRSENRTDGESPYYGNQIAYIPEHQGSAAVNFENPWVNVTVHGHGMSQRYTNNEHYDGTRIAGYAEIGITAYREWRCGRGVLEVRADIKNLLDKQYEIVGHYPMPGRSWQMAVGYRF